MGKTFELLNCDKHKGLMKKLKKDLSKCRPDITHQVRRDIPLGDIVLVDGVVKICSRDILFIYIPSLDLSVSYLISELFLHKTI